ncbi:hypothetical protein C8Q73DRAFT_143800 [Cubamyces lactineus]|nr:hypothetical protein C8Q73DRAFT_143800 [Cubamyces lactineus]
MAPRRNAKKAGGVTCSICGAVLAGDLARHERTHKAATFECSWPGCGRTFRQRANLKCHEEKWHLGVRKHVCRHEWVDEFGEISACVATFDEPGGLTRHRKIMHGYNPDMPKQEDPILFRSSAKQAQDRHYYRVVAAERTAARRQQSGLPAIEHGLPGTSVPAPLPPAGRTPQASQVPRDPRAPQAPRVSTPASTLASPLFTPGLAHPASAIASSSYRSGNPSSGTRPPAPAFLHPSSSMRSHFANAAPTMSMYAPPARAGNPVRKQDPQVQNFVDVAHPTNLYNPGQIPMQFFEMPPTEFPEKSEFDMGWAMHNSLLAKPASPPRSSSAGWDTYYYSSASTPGLSSGSSSPHSAGPEDWDSFDEYLGRTDL